MTAPYIVDDKIAFVNFKRQVERLVSGFDCRIDFKRKDGKFFAYVTNKETEDLNLTFVGNSSGMFSGKFKNRFFRIDK